MANEFAPCTEAQKQAVLERLADIRQNIAESCAAAGRDPSEITLMAVTKTVSPELINLAVDHGVSVLGENRVQEYLSKRAEYRSSAEVQFIGHLQTNKVKQIIDKVSQIRYFRRGTSDAAQRGGRTQKYPRRRADDHSAADCG